MRTDNINAVADAIERATLPIGFNMRDYLRRAGADTPDHTGGNHEFTADIAGWTCMLFTRDGLRRVRPLEVSHLRLIVENNDMLAYVEHAFEIAEQQALDLCAPGHWQEKRQLRNEIVARIPRELAVQVLRALAATGEVHWRVTPRRDLEPI